MLCPSTLPSNSRHTPRVEFLVCNLTSPAYSLVLKRRSKMLWRVFKTYRKLCSSYPPFPVGLSFSYGITADHKEILKTLLLVVIYIPRKQRTLYYQEDRHWGHLICATVAFTFLLLSYLSRQDSSTCLICFLISVN